MATYQRFEDLPVWQKSADLAAQMFSWTVNPLFRGKGDLANQLQRASLSISNNIAEGFERGTTNELLKFLYIARGSAGEVRSMLCVMDRMEGISELKLNIANLKNEVENISRQIRAWANSLQNSEIGGQRHLNDVSRKQFEQGKRIESFRNQQKQCQQELEAKLKRNAVERDAADRYWGQAR